MVLFGKQLIKKLNKLLQLKKYLMLFRIPQMHKEHLDKFYFYSNLMGIKIL